MDFNYYFVLENFNKIMRKSKLPDLVFNKDYGNYYLYSEYDIIFNESFYSKIISLINSLKSNFLFIKINDFDEQNNIPKILEYKSPKITDIQSFYEMEVNIKDNAFPLHCIDHYIYDENKEWEIYISIENEISIFGCNDTLKSLFEVIFAPYKEESLEIKYKIIGDMFNNETSRLEFIKSLEKTYNFSKNKW